VNVAHTAFDLPRAGDSDDELHDDVSIIAQLAFARANRAGVAGETRVQPLLREESLELDLSDPVQRRFGDYELLELIGEGGMGVVYRARQIGLDREVAVKLLAAGPWASAEFVERFRREAQNAARMQHPNIVAIYEVGDAEELQFFSMRLVHGGSLAGALKQEGRLAPLRAAQLLRTIAEAVDYAHRLGVLHLDLKPANVLLDEDGAPHVADFGLARRLDQGLAADNTEVSGTPSYMAPEQATAGRQNITPATDIWGLGAVLHELVTGLPPFVASTPQGTLKLVVDGTVRSPRRHVPDLPLDLEAIILKCLARNVADRYPSGRALADDLTRFIEGREVRARPLNAARRAARWARREPTLAATAAVALLALLTGLVATTQQWRRADANAQRAGQQKQLAEQAAALSRDRLWAGRRDAALRLMQDGRGFDALVPLLANVEEREAAGMADAGSVERREIGLIQSQGVTLIDRMLITDANPMATALSADGSLLAVALNDISVRWYATATLRELGRVDLSDWPTSDGESHVPQLLEFVDGHRLRVTLEWYSYITAPSHNDSVLVDLDAARVLTPPPAFHGLQHAVFNASGKHVLLFNDRNQVQLWQVAPWKPLSAVGSEARDFSQPYWLAPDASIGIGLIKSVGEVHRFDLRRAVLAGQIEIPRHESLTAWSANRAARLLALGDADGRVFLLDLRTLRARALPIPTGRDVTWLAFSEDDAWLAVARLDGAAYVFDVEAGVPLHSGQMQHEFPLRSVAVNHAERMLVASGSGEAAVWRLPEESPGGYPAARLVTNPTSAARAGPYWASAELTSGLIATADLDGEVRLWRLPHLRPLPARPGLGESGRFDGRHLADVEHDKVRVAAITGAAASTPWHTLPQRVGFAELGDAARTLVATAGPWLHVLDARTLEPRLEPIALRANPMRFALDPGGRRVILGFGANDPGGFREHLEAIDLQSGARVGASPSVAGPLRDFALSADGTRLLTVGRADGATDLFDAATLQRLGHYPHDEQRPVVRADFVGDSLWMITRDIDPMRGDDTELLRWNPAAGKVLERRTVPGAWPVGLAVLGTVPILSTKDRVVFDAGAPHSLSSPRLFLGEASTVFAFSHDRQMIAYAFGRDVYLYDAATLAPMTPPLHTNMGMVDMVTDLQFAPDDRSLLFRTASEKWFLWPTPIDARPLDELKDAAALLAADSGPRVLRATTAAEKSALRARDPGAAAPPEPRPAFAAARWLAGAPVPARPAGLDPLLLDLTDYYTTAPETSYNLIDSVLPSMRGVWFGVPRIDGVDYDLRGGVELRWGKGGRLGTRAFIPIENRAAGIGVPARPIAAFHVLLYLPLPVPESGPREYASITIHYRDGGSERVPLRTNIEVPGLNERDRLTPIAWDQGYDLRLTGEFRSRLVNNPRLVNPHPERLIRSIDVNASSPDHGWSAFVILAITAEPVIAAADSRNLQ
jgi:WD40 repeat protein